MCFPSAFNLPSILRPGQSIERPVSLSPSLPVYHSASAMARGLPNISLCFCVTSFFILLSKGKTFLFKTLSLLSSLVNIFFCMILPHNYEINIIITDLNFHVYSLWFPWTGPCCDCKFTCHWKQSLNEKPKWSSEKCVNKTTILSMIFRRRRHYHHHHHL